MKCEICKKVQGKRYIAFPESDHLTEEIMVLWICKRCKPNWYKLLPKDSRLSFRHWILRSTTFKYKMMERILTSEQKEKLEYGRDTHQGTPLDLSIYKMVGYIPDEEDISI